MKKIMATLAIVFAVFIVAGVIKEHEVQREEPETLRSEPALRSELDANKATLLAQAKSFIDSGTSSGAVALLERFEPINDPDVTATLTAARASFLRDLIKHEPSGNHQQRYNYLTKLAEFLPDDEAVKLELAAEKALLSKDAARASKLEQLSATAFCNQFRHHPSSDALTSAFVAHGGRQEFADRVREARIYMGMNEFEVRCAWGSPGQVNRTIGNGFEHKQMVYGDRYVYMENDVMTGLQD
jgi:hypothetical protein